MIPCIDDPDYCLPRGDMYGVTKPDMAEVRRFERWLHARRIRREREMTENDERKHTLETNLQEL